MPSPAFAAIAVSAADPAFRYEGRFDTTDATAPVVIWQGSRIAVDFEGAVLELRFSDVKGQVFFDATIDGRTTRVDLREGRDPVGARFGGLGPGRHSLRLFKRSEAAAGTVAFRGVTVTDDAKVHAPAAPGYALRMLFLGDSITVGANNEDGAEDQWDDRATHNNAKSYARLTADAFVADYCNIAVSGMGICEGYVPFPAKNIWDRVHPSPDSPRADLATWTPDVIFLNYGENDDSFTTSENRPFPATFTAEYVALVRSVRAAWPQAQIVILRGGMFGGSQSERLRGPWEAAVAELERTDAKVAHFAFEHWTPHHPRAADHAIMADALIAWLRKQAFMGRE
ncbi:MAG: hypothetical protein IAE82_12280 [Opitutaceae bacterium]|nr:hypothetical protein [Opitutaceae bacterium]